MTDETLRPEEGADAAPSSAEPSQPDGSVEEPQPQTEAADAPADHAQVQADLEDLIAKAGKADEYLDIAKRTQADFENYRKRAVREAAAAQERGAVKLAKELLPAIDNLERALGALGEDADPGLVSGIKLVHSDVLGALSRAGIEPYSPDGEAFDPVHHEAVAQQPIEGATPGTVVEVYQRGYRLGESVLRPARVLVAG